MATVSAAQGPSTVNPVRPLLLGLGWFPEQLGGLNRYFRGLLEELWRLGVRAEGIVVSSDSAVPGVAAVADRRGRLSQRLRGVARSAARARRDGIDVVNVHFALYALWPVRFGSLRGLPLVVHFHGPWADEGAMAGDPRLVRWMKNRIERMVYAKAYSFVTLSNAFKRVLSERYDVVPWKVAVVRPAVDLDAFSPGDKATARRDLGFPESAWIVGICRRLVSRVGVSVAVEALRHLNERQDSLGRDTVLWIAGDGPERAALQEQVRRLGLEGQVRFLGAVSDEVLRDAYRASDVSLVPSLALEGFGLVVLEALACGTPVVVSEAGALPEVVHPLDPTLSVETGNAEALAERIATARNGTHPLPPSRRCRAYAEQFSWRAVADDSLRRFEQAMRRQPPRRKRRIVFLDHVAKLSGAELSMAQLLPCLEEFETHVILGEDGPLVGHLLRRGVSVEVLPMAERARELRRNRIGFNASSLAAMGTTLAYTAKLARRLRRLEPDLVQTNSLKAHLYGALASRLASIPSVLYLRDRITGDYLDRPGRALVRSIARRLPSAVVANSAATLKSIQPLACVARVIPPAVDMPHAREVRGTGRALHIGIVGRLAETKGQEVFLRAFARAFPDDGTVAVVVGSPLFGETEYASSLRRLTVDLGIVDRVDFRGFRSDVYGELADMDILVHASPIPEPFGRVIIEGMAAGLPVIASAAGGPLEIVRDGVDGILSPIGDVLVLAEHLRRLAADPELRGRLGVAAAQSARRFAPESIATSWAEFYGELLGGEDRG